MTWCSVLQCVAVCCSVLQCVAVCCSVLQCVAVCCSRVLQCVAVCCSELQSVAVCVSVLQCVAVCCSMLWCTVHTLQHTATHCHTLPHTATHCNRGRKEYAIGGCVMNSVFKISKVIPISKGLEAMIQNILRRKWYFWCI